MNITQSNNKQTALYCRTANFSNFAIEQQKERLLAFANKNGYENIRIYVDNGFCGLDYDNRPAFMELDTNIKKGIVARVIAVDLSRIGRNNWALVWAMLVKQENVAVKFLNDINGKIFDLAHSNPLAHAILGGGKL